MAAFAEYESDVRSDYARSNHRWVRSQGRPWGGRSPFGYDRHPTERSYVINEERAAVVRHVFARYQAGASQYDIARELNDRSMLRPSGARWSCQLIGRLLDNPAYAALCIVDDELIPGVWEPIVERGMWEEVRRSRASDKRRHRQLRVRKGGPYLLSGLVFCGYCGRKVHHRSRAKSRNGVYLCVEPGGKRCPGGSIDCARADEFVTHQFLDRCQFVLQKAKERTLFENEQRWAGASLVDRRSLLFLAIRRVVLVPKAEEERLRRVPGTRRELRIEWGVKIRESTSVAVVSTPHPARETVPHVSEGRSDMMRRFEANEARKRWEDRSKRSKVYFEEWRLYTLGLSLRGGESSEEAVSSWSEGQQGHGT